MSFELGNARLGLFGLVLLLAAAPALAGHDKSDVVTTDDGSTYIGEIKSVQNATLSLDTETDDIRHYGTLGPSAKPGHLSIVGPSETIEVGLADIVEVVPIEPGLWKRLDGSANFGLSYTQANDALQYNLSGDANYRTRKTYATVSGQSIFNTQTGGETTNQHQLKLILAQVAQQKWGSFEVGGVGANPDLRYDLRWILGGGAMNFLIESSRQSLGFYVGGVYNRENVAGNSDVDQSAEALIRRACTLA